MNHQISDWRPDDAILWETTGRKAAWKTLWITAINWWFYTRKGCEKPS